MKVSGGCTRSLRRLLTHLQVKDILKTQVQSRQAQRHLFPWPSLQYRDRVSVHEEGRVYRRRQRPSRRGCELSMPKETWAWVERRMYIPEIQHRRRYGNRCGSITTKRAFLRGVKGKFKERNV